MTREEVRNDLRRMRNLPERTLRSRRLSPEERIRLLRLRAQGQVEADERQAAEAEVEVDEQENAQGDAKKARINILDNRESLKERVINTLTPIQTRK